MDDGARPPRVVRGRRPPHPRLLSRAQLALHLYPQAAGDSSLENHHFNAKIEGRHRIEDAREAALV